MLEPGDRVDGRFEVEARVGAGGMAEVFRVRHLSLGGVYALKILSLPNPGLRERFLREGQIQAQIRHPNVVAVTDVLEHRGRLGLLMEYVDHVTLQELVDLQGGLSLEDSLQLFARILSGVVAAHALGVLHRDLKPANILLARTPQGLVPKITDFGIAKVVLDGMPIGWTREGSMMGTPGYMSPEQARNAKDVDQRGDVFALGAILYTMLAGQAPFDLDSPDIFEDTMAGRFTPLDQVLPELPASVVQAVHDALQPDRERRTPTARALGDALYADRPELVQLIGETVSGVGSVSVGAAIGPRTATAPPRPLPPTGGTRADTLEQGRAAATTAGTLATGGRSALVALTLGATLSVLIVGVLAAIWWTVTGPAPTPEQAEAPAVQPQVATTTAAPLPAPELASAAPEAPPALARVANQTARPSTTAAPELAPSEVVAPATQPEVAAQPAAPEAAPATIEEPAAPAPEAVVEPIPSLTGTWTGTANGRPATLAITSQSGTAIRAELRLVLGSSQVVSALAGTLDASGALHLEEPGGGMVLNGKLSGDQLSGTFMRAGQGRALAWQVSR